MSTETKHTPMMAQWHACKEAAKEAILFFRLGDFYESFYEDAELAAKALDLTLTKRQDVPMCGVPFHASEGYIDRLVAKGYRVAVAEQTEDPKKAKGIVKREVTRVVTPGTLINSSLLSDRANNFFVSVAQVGSIFGLACLDLTTSEFRTAEFEELESLANELYRLRPSEILVPERFHTKHEPLFNEFRQAFPFLLNNWDDWRYEHRICHDFLIGHFAVHSLDGFGLRGMVAGINAAGALLCYLKDQLTLPVDHIQEIQVYSSSHYLSIDRATQRNLELTHSLQDGSKKNTLLEILDRTCTPMGARLIRRWIKQPLIDPAEIEKRQQAVAAYLSTPQASSRLISMLDQVRDMERLIIKVSSGYAGPRDLAALASSFLPVASLRELISQVSRSSPLLAETAARLDPIPEMTAMIRQALVEEPPARITDGNLFRTGFHSELDELRRISKDSKAWIADYQARIKEETGIKTLKVGYNRMFGYYIEVSKGQAASVPPGFERRQTLTNGERYITPELKEYEQKVLSADEKSSALEQELFNALRIETAKYCKRVMETAHAVALLDALLSLARAAERNNYCRPIVDGSGTLQIIDGRHPVIEGANLSEKFVPNDTMLDEEANRLLLITGPNMAGKSTYIRQVALIAIMAQIGSFVPAKTAHIGILDQIFSRIGASDDLTKGQSTFMVEMTETANILNNATDRSLVILDEIGRGTSTYDGISIAWSVAEYLLTTEGRQAKTLFATHYWELTKLEEKVPGAVNYNVAVHESGDHIVFLRKIIKGGTDKSYGIHVGRLAGLPREVIARAREILVHLEENANQKSVFEPSKPRKRSKIKLPSNEVQLTFF